VKVYDEPCGPATTWQGKAVGHICLAANTHNGYSVPNGTAGVDSMRAAAADPRSNGLQSISWQQGQDIAFVIKAGQQHMSGEWALAYSRTRIYTTDFNRMARQQAVLKALRTTFDPCQIVGSIPKLLGSVAAIPYAFNTNLPLSNAADLNAWASLAKRVLGGNIKSVIMDPATTGQPFVNGYPAVDATSWAKFKDVTTHSLDAIPAASASGGTSGGTGC
jgi:hypothetical protein